MSSRRGQRSGRSAAEWVTLALSVAIVGALVAVAVLAESQREHDAPVSLELAFDVEGAWTADDDYYVPYTVFNAGSEAITAADIWIEVTRNGALVESAEITVEFLPLQGRQDGVYVSKYDPATHSIGSRLESAQIT